MPTLEPEPTEHNFGRLEAYVAEYVNDSPATLRVRLTEAQWNTLEMARKADQAERRAEEAEFHVEQLRDARDRAEGELERLKAAIEGVGHQGRCPDCPDRCAWCDQPDGKHENGCRFGLGPDEPDAFDSLPIAALLHARLASWFGDDRQSFLVADLVPVVTQIVAEFQHNAVEMARKADLAERRAEEAEYHVEQLRDARDAAERKLERACGVLDGWEHDGPKGYEFHLLILRVREALDGAVRACRRCGCGVDGDGQCPCGCDEPNDCDHDWLDRPESDTRECLICGTEVAG